MKQTADVIIVGAGLMGCTAAFELSKRGLDVVVVERATVGAGGTGRSSAIVRQHYSNETTARMALYSVGVFREFDDQVGGESGYLATGWVGLASESTREGLEANVALQRGVGIHTSVIGPEELCDLMPGVETGDTVAAAYEPEGGYADPHLTVNAYADAARRNGATVLVGTEVTGIRFAEERVVGIDTAAGGMDAPRVVNCAGPWGAAVAALAGVDIPVIPARVQVAVFRRPEEYRAHHPVVMDFINGAYLRPETGGLTLVGSIDPAEGKKAVDPDDYPEHADTGFVEFAGERLLTRYPPMENAEFTTGYASLYGITPDWHPVLDEVPAGSGHYLCVGFSGHGFKLGPAVGVMAADLVTGSEDRLFDIDLFRLGRFAEGDPVRGTYEHSIAG
jgi:glycine/D-amino acid oxidase-like deaminating enzyme